MVDDLVESEGFQQEVVCCIGYQFNRDVKGLFIGKRYVVSDGYEWEFIIFWFCVGDVRNGVIGGVVYGVFYISYIYWFIVGDVDVCVVEEFCIKCEWWQEVFGVVEEGYIVEVSVVIGIVLFSYQVQVNGRDIYWQIDENGFLVIGVVGEVYVVGYVKVYVGFCFYNIVNRVFGFIVNGVVFKGECIDGKSGNIYCVKVYSMEISVVFVVVFQVVYVLEIYVVCWANICCWFRYCLCIVIDVIGSGINGIILGIIGGVFEVLKQFLIVLCKRYNGKQVE